MTGQQEREPTQGHDEVVFGLRAPRVAIVFPASSEQWTYFARLALWEANQLWGGAGFVLVPHRDGDVAPVVLEAVAAYDPDYVVRHHVSWGELAVAGFDALPAVMDEAGKVLEGDKLLERLGARLDEEAIDPVTDNARKLVSDACEVYRRRDNPGREQSSLKPTSTDAPTKPKVGPPPPPRWDASWTDGHENLFTLNSDLLTPASTFGDGVGYYIAAPSDLAGPWGALVAATVGAVDRPGPPTDDAELTEEEATELASWMYGRVHPGLGALPPSAPPPSLVHHPLEVKLAVDASMQPSAWTRTTQGLDVIAELRAGRRTTIVVGDSAEDFALALISDRLWGKSVWLHSEWAPAVGGKIGAIAESTLGSIGSRARATGSVVVTSASLNEDDLAPVVALLAPPIGGFGLRLAEPDEPGPAEVIAPEPAGCRRRRRPGAIRGRSNGRSYRPSVHGVPDYLGRPRHRHQPRGRGRGSRADNPGHPDSLC